MFLLCAFLIIVAGDIPAISMVMRIKGHNGYSPCRMCKILGIQVPGSRNTTNYIPLDRSQHPDVRSSASATKKYDPLQLPMQTHDEMLAQGKEVQLAPTAAAAERLSKKYGIKGIPILRYLLSLKFPKSFPYDFMYLIWENLIKNLVLLWTGGFKGVNTGSESYELGQEVWEVICEATAAAGDTLPSSYCARPPNPTTERSACTADSWSFWTQYIGPVLLHQKFSKAKYYKHFVKLVRMLRICLQFEISRQDVADLRVGFATWVEDFERFVFPCYQSCLEVPGLAKTPSSASTTNMTLNKLRLVPSPSTHCFILLTVLRRPVQFGLHGPSLWKDFVVDCSQ
ncbi:hypothetical protein HYDPIDRAFT_91839 [Hydnomerulius pinastri MD-312]|uniref:Defective in cullin neddylation protein n=1 Tax=Hydnomerulius pinastri MD-312 TaxID=994086 RepID=A0A0C9W8N9_9AGAM|nr:hypothetical protein HYDPIDRAFT_91839 [Hydnomerulius pinastri MD-312]